MKIALRILLWVVALGFAAIAIFMIAGSSGHSGSDAAGRGLAQAFGIVAAIVAVAGMAALLLARHWRGGLVVAVIILVLPFV